MELSSVTHLTAVGYNDIDEFVSISTMGMEQSPDKL